MRRFGILLVLLALISAGHCADRAAGRVVWWGRDFSDPASLYTNGVLESDKQQLTNVIAIAAGAWRGIAIKNNGTALVFGSTFPPEERIPEGLSNVVSVAWEGSAWWAIKRDGSVTEWGSIVDEANLVAGLSNISKVAWAGDWRYLALKKDGTLLGMRFNEGPSAETRPVTVRGVILSNVVSVASGGFCPLILKGDGTVLRLGFQSPGASSTEPSYRAEPIEGGIILHVSGEVSQLPYRYTLAEPVVLNGRPLSNVVSLASGMNGVLALKKDGTVVAWAESPFIETQKPLGFSNVTAISTAGSQSVALKRDGTVVAWGNDNSMGQLSVPAGLSNVAAIAAGGFFGLALTTGEVPPSVHIIPHGRLEEMTQKSDFIFKGQALSSVPFTNSAFQNPQMNVHATTFKVISVLKGDPNLKTVTFQHYTNGPGAWGGGSWPSFYQFRSGQSYLVFAANLDKPDVYYVPLSNTVPKRAEFRQMAGGSRNDDDGVLRTLDARALNNISIKEAHWLELNRLLTNNVSTDALYALGHLNAMSETCIAPWAHTDDFRRETVLKAVLPLTTNKDDEVAVSAIGLFQLAGTFQVAINGQMPILRGCSETRPECLAQVSLYADALARIASESPSILRRTTAIAAFSCTSSPIASNALPRWLGDSAEAVRAQAALLLPDFPGEFSESLLRKHAADPSPEVRAAVADAIGDGTIEHLLPALANLFSEPLGPTNPVPPLTMEELQYGGRILDMNVGDVHTCAGFALLKFDTDQVASILKTNLDDPGFRLNFLLKLAEKDAGPWLDNMTKVMEVRRARAEAKADASIPLDLILSGTYYRCWHIICDYLSGLPAEQFAGGKMDRYLNMLETAASPLYSGEATKLYELCRMKNLNERAVSVRSAFEKKEGRYGAEWFDKLDAKYTNAPGKSRQ
jgi:hypothetical protein